MTWFVNLHTLPAGQHMYSALLADSTHSDMPGDEIDFTGRSDLIGATAREAAVEAALKEGYSGVVVLEVVDQSAGERVYARS